MASALEMLVGSFASLASNSFEAFVAASFVPACPPDSSSFSFPASAGPPFDTDSTAAAEEEEDFGFGPGADMFGLDGPLLLVLVRGLVLLPRAETEEGAA